MCQLFTFSFNFLDMFDVLPPYELKRSVRSRTVRVSVRVGGKVIVTAPHYASERVIKSFLVNIIFYIFALTLLLPLCEVGHISDEITLLLIRLSLVSLLSL